MYSYMCDIFWIYFSCISIHVIKVRFYIANYPVCWTAQSNLHFSSPDRTVHSDANSASLEKNSSNAAITRNDNSLTFPPPPIARYLFIQLSELGRYGEQIVCPNFETVAWGIEHLIASPALYH